MARGHLRHGQIVEVPQGQCGAVGRGQLVEDLRGAQGVELGVPRVVGHVAVDRPEVPFLALALVAFPGAS